MPRTLHSPLRGHPARRFALCLMLSGTALLSSGLVAAAVEKAHIDQIDGRAVESVGIKHPSSKVVVVFESGLRGTLDNWDKVLDSVSPSASVFAYNRPGYGNSGATDAPRDGETVVKQLRQVLKHKGFHPPYVLVGHSLGGLYMQLFARQYPDEVVGIVLVDGLLPRLVKKPDEFPLSTRFAKRMFFSASVRDEVDAIHDTGEKVLGLPGIDHKPMISLINVPKSATAVPVDFGAFNRDPATVAMVRGLYPNAKKVVVDSDHQMHKANPEVVAKAISEILGKVSNPAVKAL
jgi:pimeloyl-ACP methyl ester carboxylesterase